MKKILILITLLISCSVSAINEENKQEQKISRNIAEKAIETAKNVITSDVAKEFTRKSKNMVQGFYDAIVKPEELCSRAEIVQPQISRFDWWINLGDTMYTKSIQGDDHAIYLVKKWSKYLKRFHFRKIRIKDEYGNISSKNGFITPKGVQFVDNWEDFWLFKLNVGPGSFRCVRHAKPISKLIVESLIFAEKNGIPDARDQFFEIVPVTIRK